MNPTLVLELAKMMRGTASHIIQSSLASGWATDSRDVKPGDIFLAIKGARVDGHLHVEEAHDRGAVASIVERTVGTPHILVSNLPVALARMASAFRDRFSGPVIGVTGSAGKTMTKELTAAAVAPLGKVLKTEGNRNTEYTAPLLWSELTDEHKVVVVEMGMRGFGHISHLAKFSRPTIGLVTNIGFSHMELVGDRAGIARAKAEMLRTLPVSGAAVLWHEDEFIGSLKSETKAPVRTFGASAGADCQITQYVASGWTSCSVAGMLEGASWEGRPAAVGRHIALDAAAAILAASCAGVAPTEAAKRLAQATLPPMRMEVREWNGATLLVDVYNASPASMKAAIEVVGEGNVTGRRVAVIGEMRELGDASGEGHRDVARALLTAGIDRVLLYGAGTSETFDELSRANKAGISVSRAENLEDVKAFISRVVEPGDVCLIKGSRALELEKAVPN
jgi:UDP-N-acetylmuramoyl-tripeptide--D-alanyl-D-alanine ligase